jgi:hypothetical protein
MIKVDGMGVGGSGALGIKSIFFILFALDSSNKGKPRLYVLFYQTTTIEKICLIM